jgi:hypothetical protein
MNKDLSRKTFALLSTSALAAGAARGAAVYSPVNIIVSAGTTLDLDLNQANTPDFKMAFGGGSKPFIDNSPNTGGAFVLADANQELPLTAAGTSRTF